MNGRPQPHPTVDQEQEAAKIQTWIIRGFVWFFIFILVLLALPDRPFSPDPSKTFILIKQLPLGWMRFLNRTAPEITANWDLIGMAVLCGAGMFAGSHVFLAWLHGEWIERKTAESPNTSSHGCGVWRKSWTAAINGLLLLCFLIGASFTGAVHQVGWLVASDEPVVTWTHLAVQPESVAIKLSGSPAARNARRNGMGSVVTVQQALETYQDIGVWDPDGDNPRSFLLIDSDDNLQGVIVFYPNVPSPHGDYIGVLDSRNVEGPDDYPHPERFPREQLPELLRRYQDELYPFY